MSVTLRIIVESVDDVSQKILSRDVIKDTPIKPVESIMDLGFRHQEQIDILQKVQDALLNQQSQFLEEKYEACPKCGSKVTRRGFKQSEFHSVFTDHKVGTRKLHCTRCDFSSVPSVQSLLGTSMHPDLAKLQCEISAQHSYRETEEILDKKSSACRQINNHDRIRKTVSAVGQVIEKERHVADTLPCYKPSSYSEELILHVDGGHVSDKDPTKQSFEVLTSVIYNPRNVVFNPKTRENKIVNKSCVASALNDEQLTIKTLTQQAAKEQGLTSKTRLTALCDGARNCWNVVDSLESMSLSIDRILDWFHIGMKFTNIALSNDEQRRTAQKAKWHLWRGCSKKALLRLNQLLDKVTMKSEKLKLQKLIHYIDNNKDYIVNYKDRMNHNLVFTSQLAESTVESIINRRCKGQQHMSWTRNGIHSLLQVRAAIASNHWIENCQRYLLNALTTPIINNI